MYTHRNNSVHILTIELMHQTYVCTCLRKSPQAMEGGSSPKFDSPVLTNFLKKQAVKGYPNRSLMLGMIKRTVPIIHYDCTVHTLLMPLTSFLCSLKKQISILSAFIGFVFMHWLRTGYQVGNQWQLALVNDLMRCPRTQFRHFDTQNRPIGDFCWCCLHSLQSGISLQYSYSYNTLILFFLFCFLSVS